MSAKSKPRRKKVPVASEAAVLIKSARRCLLCFHLKGDFEEKEGQIVHLDSDRTNGTEGNLAWMCLRHHSLFDSKTSQHKNYSLREVKTARCSLYAAVRARLHQEPLSGPGPRIAPAGRPVKLPANLRRRVSALALRPAIEQALEGAFCADDYPAVMALSTEQVINPIWRAIPESERVRLSRLFSPFGNLPPRMMHLDIFLIRADDIQGRPRLLNYFSGKPHSGWQAFLLPFRHRKAGESEVERQSANAIDIASFLGIDGRGVRVETLGDQFVVSIKPDPGYSELAAYIFEFCAVRLDDPPAWMSSIDCGIPLDQSIRRFRWIHPEEMEQNNRSMLVNGDVIRGVHYFFSTTLPAVPESVPTGFLH